MRDSSGAVIWPIIGVPGATALAGRLQFETDIRGAFEAGMQSFLVLTGSTRLEMIGDYVYQPTRVLQSVADIIEEVKTGKVSDRLNSPIFMPSDGSKLGRRHQTDIFAFHKPRPRPAMTK